VGGAIGLFAPGNDVSTALGRNARITPIITSHNVNENIGATFYLDADSGKVFSLPAGYDTRNFEEQGIIQTTGFDWSYIEDLSRFPVRDATPVGQIPGTEVQGVEGVMSTESLGDASNATPNISVEDAIITSDGQVIRTDPEDNIYTFKGDVSIAPANAQGGVSMAPANTTREFSGSPVGYNNQQSSVVNNVTNNYINQSNFNLSDLLPGSEFDPVGV
jgi:hypothetical protein